MRISIHVFNDHLQLVIQTHGYEGWQGGESNLLLFRSLIGKLSNTSHTSFRYNVNNVAEHLASRGVRAIPGERHFTEELRGRQWIIRPTEAPTMQNPHSASMRTRMDGSLAIKFGDYSSSRTHEITIGDEDEEEIVMMAISDDNGELQEESLNTNEDLEVIYLLASLSREAVPNRKEIPVKWDEYDGTSKDEWINPFSAEGGRDEVAFSAAETMDYPQLRNLEAAFSALSTAESRRPQEPTMGPPMYPPAIGTSQQREFNIPEIRARVNSLRGGYAHNHNERFNLPSAQANEGAMLVLPEDISQYSDVISKWESITLNLVNERNWPDNKSKVIYIENLLGEVEKKIWIQWRMVSELGIQLFTNVSSCC